MVIARWNGQIIAQSDETIVVERNHYFPRAAVNDDYLISSNKTSSCPWKGVASYFSIKVGEDINEEAAWIYPETRRAAKEIEGMVAFWRGVEIID